MNNMDTNKCLIGKPVPNSDKVYLDINTPLPNPIPKDYEQVQEFCYCNRCIKELSKNIKITGFLN